MVRSFALYLLLSCFLFSKNNYPIILVHGFLGWGKEEVGELNYWGGENDIEEFLIEKGYDNKLGARPLRRAVEKYLEDSLAEEVLSGSLRKNKLIRVLITDDEEPKLYFTQEEVEGKVSVSPSSKEEEKDLDS